MKIGTGWKAVSIAGLLTAWGSVADADSLTARARQTTGGQAWLREGSNVSAPFAFIRYCVANPGICRTSHPRAVDWSGSVWESVTTINAAVNASIRPVNDRGDTWTSNVASGDCEDFALTKREKLLAAGVPGHALRIATAKTRVGEGHAVLVVSTSSGDYVLDNRTNAIRLWHETDLSFLKIASGEDPRLWRRVL